MYKKVYVEITNNCNLNCDFCPHNKREHKFMNFDEFKTILNKLENHTKYLYFHILGEPLLHPNINEFIDYASSKYNINITTNGYLINRVKDNKNIRQINISLQSYTPNSNKTLEQYLNDIFDAINELKKTTYISLRMWVLGDNTKEILDYINNKYNTNIEYYEGYQSTALEDNVFLAFNKEFEWPNMNKEVISELGYCYALKDHIGILVDGTVVPCCLDSEGIIKLGNIYHETLEDIINSNRYQNMLNGFKNKHKCEELCKRCNFINKKI